MDTPLPPPHPVDSLTAYELSRYRRQLEHALKALPGHAPARGQLQQRLAEVMVEQRSRTTITGSSEPGMTAAPAAPGPPPRGRAFLVPNGLGSCPSARTTLTRPARSPARPRRTRGQAR